MQLTDEQKQHARTWVEAGMKLSDFQKRLETEFGIRMTYMEVRFLVDDLKVMPKDAEPAKKPEPVAAAAPEAPAAPAEGQFQSGVQVSVDTVTRPGALASGSVTFSDGQKAQWYLDQMGRFGMAAAQKGYRPSQEDLQDFQTALDRELQKLGL